MSLESPWNRTLPVAVFVDCDPGEDPSIVAGLSGLAPPPIELLLRPELLSNPRVHVLWSGHGIPEGSFLELVVGLEAKPPTLEEC